MSKLSDFKTDIPYANEERKQQLLDNREPFDILAVNLDTNGQYGPRWTLTCEDDNGVQFRLRLSATPSHNDLFERAADAVSTVNPLGPVILVEVRTKAGYMFRTIKDAGGSDA